MILTEGEAKEKTCPHMIKSVNTVSHYDDGSERDGEYEYNCCAASGCMAWQWADPFAERRVRHPRTLKEARQSTEPERPANLPDSWEWIGTAWEDDGEDNYWIESETDAEKRRRGYCGLCRPAEV